MPVWEVRTDAPACSVIVAAFDVSAFIDDCLQSLRSQTREDIEILVIDDGSRDDTATLVRRHTEVDARVQLISRPNGGLSAARNTGLEHARGTYVIFVDGDDWVEPNMVADLVARAKVTEAEVVIAGFIVDRLDATGRLLASEERTLREVVIDDGQPLNDELVDDDFINLLGYAWNKAYLREFISEHSLRFEADVSLVEDILFNAAAMTSARRVSTLAGAHVHYVQRPRMTLGSRHYEDFLDLRGRALQACLQILSAWGVSGATRHRVAHHLALTAVIGMTRSLSEMRHRPLGQRAEDLRLALAANPHVRDLAFAATAPRARDRVVRSLIRRGHLATALVTASAARGIQSRVRRPRLGPPHPAESMTSAVRKLMIRGRLRLALARQPHPSTNTGPRGRARVFIALAADYGNLGDLAITYAQKRFLQEMYVDADVELLPISRTLEDIARLRDTITPRDIITLVGGGNTGDLYDDIQYLRELVIASFPDTPIVSFPQTIDFSDSPYGRWAQRRAARVYNAHPDLTVMARDSSSFARVEDTFYECTVTLAPDVVLTLDRSAPSVVRDGVVMALRSDLERGLTDADHRRLARVARQFGPVQRRDTHIGEVRLDEAEAEAILNRYWADIRSARLVVTDRLHAMIFAVITGTPCVALDSGTGKVGQFHRDWLSHHPRVRLVSSAAPEEVEEAARCVMDRLGAPSPDLGATFTRAFPMRSHENP